MSSNITATLVVDFDSGDSEGSALVLEIDDREGGLNNGDTNFAPGDPVYYLMYKTADVSLLQHLATAGAISSAGSGNVDVEEYITFTDNKEASLRLPVSSGLSMSWLGRNAGTLKLKNPITIVIPKNGIGIARVEYKAHFTAYRLSNVPQETNKIMVFAQGKVNG